MRCNLEGKIEEKMHKRRERYFLKKLGRIQHRSNDRNLHKDYIRRVRARNGMSYDVKTERNRSVIDERNLVSGGN